MSVVVFLGPSLSAEEARCILECTIEAPAACGDILRASRQHPQVIVLIDGYFEAQPAVWHKEILWAMQEGIKVVGAASMGALRAAELQPFGMIGVGKIYQAYVQGDLEDDDEVAIAHRPALAGYAALSVALVDIRATLRKAVEEGELSEQELQHLIALAKSMHYRERTYPALLQAAKREGVDPLRLAKLQAWLETAKFSQKQTDALAALRKAASLLADDHEPSLPAFSLAVTDAWLRLCDAVSADHHGQTCASESPQRSQDDLVLEELALSGRYPALLQRAAMRFFAQDTSLRLGRQPDQTAMVRAVESLRSELDLRQDHDFARWRQEQDLSDDHLMAFIHDEVCLRWTQDLYADAIKAKMMDALRVEELYRPLVQRAQDKLAALTRSGHDAFDAPHLSAWGPNTANVREHPLIRWYFEEVKQRPVPLRLRDFAKQHGFADVATFLAGLARERWFRQQSSGDLP